MCIEISVCVFSWRYVDHVGCNSCHVHSVHLRLRQNHSLTLYQWAETILSVTTDTMANIDVDA